MATDNNAIDFNALLNDARQHHQNIQRGHIECQWISSQRLFNLLQTKQWLDNGRIPPSHLLFDTRDRETYTASQLRGALLYETSSSQDDKNYFYNTFAKDQLEQQKDLFSIILYGHDEHDPNLKQAIQAISSYVKYVREVYALKASFQEFSTRYPFLCRSLSSNHKELSIAWLRYPFELLKNSLYLASEDVLLLIESPSVRVLNINYILEISSKPCLQTEQTVNIPSSSTGIPRYTCIDPKINIDGSRRSSSLAERDNLENAARELRLRLDDSGTKTLVFSTDSVCTSASVIAGAMMLIKKWGVNTALAFLMSKKLTVPWISDQLQVLRDLEAHLNKSTALNSEKKNDNNLLKAASVTTSFLEEQFIYQTQETIKKFKQQIVPFPAITHITLDSLEAAFYELIPLYDSNTASRTLTSLLESDAIHPFMELRLNDFFTCLFITEAQFISCHTRVLLGIVLMYRILITETSTKETESFFSCTSLLKFFSVIEELFKEYQNNQKTSNKTFQTNHIPNASIEKVFTWLFLQFVDTYRLKVYQTFSAFIPNTLCKVLLDLGDDAEMTLRCFAAVTLNFPRHSSFESTIPLDFYEIIFQKIQSLNDRETVCWLLQSFFNDCYTPSDNTLFIEDVKRNGVNVKTALQKLASHWYEISPSSMNVNSNILSSNGPNTSEFYVINIPSDATGCSSNPSDLLRALSPLYCSYK